jgi:hypothetical protein
MLKRIGLDPSMIYFFTSKRFGLSYLVSINNTFNVVFFDIKVLKTETKIIWNRVCYNEVWKGNNKHLQTYFILNNEIINTHNQLFYIILIIINFLKY